jgi:serine/threonine protein kinase
MTSNKYIGKGSYGTVSRDGNKVIKKCKLFCIIETKNQYNYESDFYIDDHSIREANFYQLMNKYKNRSYIPEVSLEIKNDEIEFKMKYLGQPLSTLKYENKQKTIEIFGDILQSLHFIHSLGFTHGDLKPENILIDKNNKPTIIDFGSICFWHHPIINPQYFQRCTLYYVSPEELETNVYSMYNDMWSFGVILFEHLTCQNFIRTLLKDCNVSEKDQTLFYEYSMNIKTDKKFDSTKFLKHFYKNLDYGTIFNFITKHIKDRDFLKVVGHCLLKDTSIRCSAEKLLESIVFKRFADDISIISDVDTSLNKLDDNFRKNIQDIIWDICKSYQDFSIGIFGHSVTLFDRLVLRLNHTDKYIPYTVLSVLCVILSAIILKGNIFKASFIIELYENMHLTHSDSGLQQEHLSADKCKEYFNIIFNQSNFFLFNKSIDMFLLEKNVEINYERLRHIMANYVLTTSSTPYLVNYYCGIV